MANSEEVRFAGVEKRTGLALLFLAVLILCWFAAYSLQRMPSFDGSTNLQVAWSLAEGEGYRRTYSDRPPFPREVQTNVPFLVPAALVFRLFGIGTVQTQIVNLGYLCAFLGVAYLLLRRRFGLLPAAVAVLVLIATPGILVEGMNGYGEVAGLSWSLAALLVFPWESRRSGMRMGLAGICLGLAVCTKTVMAICAGSFGLVFVAWSFWGGGSGLLDRLRSLALVLGGFLLPIAAVELWKLMLLGDAASYWEWWVEQYAAVAKQAGTMSGFQDTQGYWSKLNIHLSFLARFYGLPVPLLLVWIVVPVLVLVPSVVRPKYRDGLLWSLVLAIAIYFVWWLLITPTQKAWHRRILNGSLMLNLVLVYGAALLSQKWKTVLRERLKWVAFIPLIACVGLAALFFASNAAPILLRGAERQLDVEQAIEFLKQMPRESRVFGLGWYSAPTLSLFSGRPFEDFYNIPVSTLDKRKPVYVVVDHSAVALRKFDWVSAVYRSRPMLENAQRVQIYEVDLASLNTQVPAERSKEVATFADFSSNAYPFVGGFHLADRSGGRWLSSEGHISLRFDGNRDVAATLYVPPLERFMATESVTLSVAFDGCAVGEAKFSTGGKRVVRFAVPEACQLQTSQVVTFRLSTDNLVRSSIAKDDRAMSLLLMGFGFVSPQEAGGGPVRSELESTSALGRMESGSPAASRTEESERVYWDLSGAPDAGGVLSVVPNPADFCESKAQIVEVAWNFADAGIRTVQIWLQDQKSQQKLWVATGRLTGRKTTGKWAHEGMQFFAVDPSSKRVLGSVKIQAKRCSQ